MASIEAAAMHRLETALSFALLGAVTYIGNVLCKKNTGRTSAAGFILVALLGAACRVFVLKREMALLSATLSDNIVFSVVDIPLYQIGLFASACVATLVIGIATWHKYTTK